MRPKAQASSKPADRSATHSTCICNDLPGTLRFAPDMKPSSASGWKLGQAAVRLVPALALLAAILSSTAAYAAGRAASLVIDANTGAVVSSYAADEPRYPASLTKMMTLYITFDLMHQGRLNEQTRIRISPRAAAAQPTKLGLRADEDIALIDAIKALITLSANDIAIAIAEHVAGSEERFAALMTQKARSIGMTRTTFKNASGLPNGEQVTTARDMVTLGLRLHDEFPKYYALFAMRDFRYAGRSHVNHNTMLNSYEGTEGIKTGYTQASGFNLVASVKRGQKHVMGAVFGGVTASSRNQTMRTLLNMALFKASSVKTRTPVIAIARAKQAPEPRPEPRPRLAAAKPTETPAPLPALRGEPAAAASTQPASQPQGKVEIAKVRPVLVAPRQPRQAPMPPPPAPVEIAAAAAPQPVRIASAPNATAPTDYRLPPIASAADAPARAPATPALRGTLPPPMAAGFTDGQSAAPVRGNSPSTLQRQAANLSGTAGAPVTPPAPRHSGVTAVAGNTVEIQIGAYSSAAEAEQQLANVRAKAADLVGSAQGHTQPVTANGRSLWRARFGGFHASNAGTVCTELRRRQIDCLVARSE